MLLLAANMLAPGAGAAPRPVGKGFKLPGNFADEYPDAPPALHNDVHRWLRGKFDNWSVLQSPGSKSAHVAPPIMDFIALVGGEERRGGDLGGPFRALHKVFHPVRGDGVGAHPDIWWTTQGIQFTWRWQDQPTDSCEPRRNRLASDVAALGLPPFDLSGSKHSTDSAWLATPKGYTVAVHARCATVMNSPGCKSRCLPRKRLEVEAGIGLAGGALRSLRAALTRLKGVGSSMVGGRVPNFVLDKVLAGPIGGAHCSQWTSGGCSRLDVTVFADARQFLAELANYAQDFGFCFEGAGLRPGDGEFVGTYQPCSGMELAASRLAPPGFAGSKLRVSLTMRQHSGNPLLDAETCSAQAARALTPLEKSGTADESVVRGVAVPATILAQANLIVNCFDRLPGRLGEKVAMGPWWRLTDGSLERRAEARAAELALRLVVRPRDSRASLRINPGTSVGRGRRISVCAHPGGGDPDCGRADAVSVSQRVFGFPVHVSADRSSSAVQDRNAWDQLVAQAAATARQAPPSVGEADNVWATLQQLYPWKQPACQLWRDAEGVRAK